MNTETASTTAPNAAPLTVIHVPFHGDSLAALNDQGKVWVPVRSLTEALGLEFSAQFRRLKRQPWATVAMMAMVAGDGKNRSTICLDLDSLPMWLATIDVKRVAPAAREKLVVYQRECAKVLREHFFGGSQPARQFDDKWNQEAPPFEFFLSENNVLDPSQTAYFFGPRGSLKKQNIGNAVRRSLAIREDSEGGDDAMMFQVFQSDLGTLGLAMDAIASELTEGDDLHDQVHAVRGSLWNTYHRMRGYRGIRGLLADAKGHAEKLHSESAVQRSEQLYDERLTNPKVDLACSMAHSRVAIENAKHLQKKEAERRQARLAELASSPKNKKSA